MQAQSLYNMAAKLGSDLVGDPIGNEYGSEGHSRRCRNC